MEIKYLGNIANTIRKLYIRGVLGDCKPDKMLDRILRDFVPFDKPVSGSWFRESTANCSWHIDGYKDFIIVAYPQPTEILITDHLELGGRILGKGPRMKNDDEVKNDIADKLITDGKAKIFRPRLGDIYLLGNNVLHRSPTVYDKTPRLVGRVWNNIYNVGEIYNELSNKLLELRLKLGVSL